ncbi:MAG: YkgJ family cysteine cluster protein [Candidatus Eremiobacteraeota bacterium]|nr:YkgJ family cysteine cluster protein [Candidatus Eremiobacteraeota bacterium]MCW5871780.1 YkgJ family cysteine cluster protein [Candidatus Eremiobacteraeota bacterium]
MKLSIDEKLNYECIQCGRSCTGWNVWLRDELAERLKELPITLRVIQERGQAFERVDGVLKMYRDEAHPACGYLNEEKLCNIHATLGFEVKPKTCRQFPFFITRLPDGQVRAGASHCCTAVRGQLGPSLSESRADIEALLEQGAQMREVEAEVEIYPGHVQPYEAVLAFERHFEEQRVRLGWGGALEGALSALATPLGGPWQPYQGLSQQLPLLSQIMTMSLLKPCLNDHNRELWQRIDQAFLGEGELEIPEYAWKAPVADLDLLIRAGVGSRFDDGIDKYRRAIWFRKGHLLAGNLVAGLLLLWSLPGILRLLTALEAWKNGREPAAEDFSQALDTVEMSLVAHSQNGELLVQKMSHHLLAMAQIPG